MPDMRYAAGMDGGGTKTVLEARAPDGRVLLRERFGPLNLNSAAAQAVRETMQGCTDALARLPGGLEACAALCVGGAGVSNPQARALLEQMLRRCGYRGALLLTGDQETALAGALGAPCYWQSPVCKTLVLQSLHFRKAFPPIMRRCFFSCMMGISGVKCW